MLDIVLGICPAMKPQHCTALPRNPSLVAPRATPELDVGPIGGKSNLASVEQHAFADEEAADDIRSLTRVSFEQEGNISRPTRSGHQRTQ